MYKSLRNRKQYKAHCQKYVNLTPRSLTCTGLPKHQGHSTLNVIIRWYLSVIHLYIPYYLMPFIEQLPCAQHHAGWHGHIAIKGRTQDLKLLTNHQESHISKAFAKALIKLSVFTRFNFRKKEKEQVANYSEAPRYDARRMSRTVPVTYIVDVQWIHFFLPSLCIQTKVGGINNKLCPWGVYQFYYSNNSSFSL